MKKLLPIIAFAAIIALGAPAWQSSPTVYAHERPDYSQTAVHAYSVCTVANCVQSDNHIHYNKSAAHHSKHGNSHHKSHH